MPIETPYLFIASMDVDAAHEDVFNEVYDEHVRHLLAVPGVRSVRRLQGVPGTLGIAGGHLPLSAPTPAYIALYEVDDPSVLASPAWAAAVEQGRWATEVRPHTRHRHHALYAVRPPVTGD